MPNYCNSIIWISNIKDGDTTGKMLEIIKNYFWSEVLYESKTEYVLMVLTAWHSEYDSFEELISDGYKIFVIYYEPDCDFAGLITNMKKHEEHDENFMLENNISRVYEVFTEYIYLNYIEGKYIKSEMIEDDDVEYFNDEDLLKNNLLLPEDFCDEYYFHGNTQKKLESFYNYMKSIYIFSDRITLEDLCEPNDDYFQEHIDSLFGEDIDNFEFFYR